MPDAGADHDLCPCLSDPRVPGNLQGPGQRLRLGATPAGVRDGVAHALLLLGPHLPPETLSSVEIVLNEVLNNIVEHAYANRGDGCVDMALDWHGDDALVTVTDRGQRMPAAAIPAAVAHDLDCPTAALPEGGFGWGLIHALAREIDYRRDGGFNRLSFRVSRD